MDRETQKTPGKSGNPDPAELPERAVFLFPLSGRGFCRAEILS